METRRTNMCVPSAIERNPEAEISFHLGDSVKKFTRTRPWTALWERKKRFHPFSPSFFFPSPPPPLERCPDCVRLRSSNERVQTKLLFR